MLLKKTCVPVCPRYSRDHYLFFIKEMYGNNNKSFSCSGAFSVVGRGC